MADNFPNVDFGWLADIPARARAVSTDVARKQTLANLDVTDSNSLLKAGSKLARAGDFEGAMKLITEGRNLKGVEQRNAAEMALLEWTKANPLGSRSAPGSTPGEGDTISIPAPAPPAPKGPDLFQGRPGAIPGVGPRSEGSAVGPQTAQAPPLTLTSPSDQIIAAAQGQAPPPEPPGPQLAGPPQAPVGPSPQTPIAGPEVFQRAPAVPAAPVAPVAPTAPVAPAATPYEQARQEAASVGQRLAGTPRLFSGTPEGRALLSQFNSALSRAKLPEKEISYQQEVVRRHQENQDRVQQGLPPLPELTRQDFANDAATVGERTKASLDLLKSYHATSQNAGQLGEKLVEIRKLMDNPRFAVGEPGYADYVRNRIGALSDIAQGMGLPHLSRETIKSITEPVALREAFQSTMNQALTAYISNRSFSDADRNALRDSLPNLLQTREGIDTLSGILDRAATRAKVEYGAASNYMRDKGDTRSTFYGMQEAVDNVKGRQAQEPILVNKDGSLTELGRRAKEAVGAPAPLPPGAVPATSSRGRKGYSIGNKFYLMDGTPVGQ